MAPILEALEAIPRSAERCIAQYADGETLVDYVVSWSDWADDIAWAQTVLAAWGVSAGDFVVVISTGHEAALYGPIIDALNSLGATVCPLEPAEFEIGRAGMFFRRFTIAAVIGLDSTLGPALVREGLLESGLRFMLARPEAAVLAAELDVAQGVVTALGPALALTCPDNGLAHVNGSAWIQSASGRAELSSRPIRHESLSALDVSGALDAGGRPECCSLGRSLGRLIAPS
ncbi:MAG: hypothetical protein JWQ77_2664 [Jatrophihabitans sp.]|nr:hypothetical protein [Jatrophihabitans sp.]